MGQGIIKIHTFHDAQTGVDDGVELNVDFRKSEMVIDISTDATALTVAFEAKSANGNWIPYTCYSYTDGSTGTQTTSADNELWQMEINGTNRIRVRITAQTGGTGTTIKGTIVG